MTISSYWNGLQPRERRILAGGGVALLVLMLYSLVWEPYSTGVERLRRQVSEQQTTLRWMQSAAQEVKRLRGSNPVKGTGGRSLLSITDGSAREAGLGQAVKRVQPDGEHSVRVWLEQGGFDSMIKWFASLHEKYGIVVDGLVVERSDGPGRVDARVVLKETG